MKSLTFIFLPLIVLMSYTSVYSQMKPVFNWERSIDSGWSTSLLTVTLSGDIIASSTANFTNLLARLNPKGEILWTLPYGSSVRDDTASVNTLYIDEYQGSVRMYGRRLWSFFSNSGWLVRWDIDSQGQYFQWCCDYKIAQQIYGAPMLILPGANNSMYLCGTVTSGTEEERDKVFFTKTDSTGKEEFKVYSDIKVDSGEAFISVNEILPQPDRGFVIVGGILYDNARKQDIFLLRIDSLGKKQWSKLYGSDKYSETHAHIVGTNDGGFIIASRSKYLGNDLTYGMYCIKTDSIGTIQWEKTYFESNITSISPTSILRTKTNKYVLTGKATGGESLDSGDCYILQIDSTGKKLLSHQFGSLGEDFLLTAKELQNGNLIIGGRLDRKMYVAELSIPELVIGVYESNQPNEKMINIQQNSEELYVRYRTPASTSITLSMYNSVGHEIYRSSSENVSTGGEYGTTIPLLNLSSGVYYIRLVTGTTSLVSPVIVIR